MSRPGTHGRQEEDSVSTVSSGQAGGAAGDSADLDTLARVTSRVRASIEKVIEGKPEVARAALVVLLAEGHLLIEDVPGVG